MPKKSNLQEFITKARQVHGNKYDYTRTIYINSRTKLALNCPVHGQFFQTSHSHLEGKGCRLCGINDRVELKKELSSQSFETRAREIHGDLYDYSKVIYTTSMTKVELGCKRHGIFYQKPNNHLNGYGCNKCGRESTTKYQAEHSSGWSASDWERGAKKSKNFDAFKVYILKLSNDEECFYKIGRTYTTISERVKSIPYKVSVIHEICNESARVIYDLENSLKREYKSYKYLPNKSFRGRHECFSVNLPVKYLIEKYPATPEGEGCVFNLELLTEA